MALEARLDAAVRNSRATVGIALVLVAVYGLQLFLAGSLRSGPARLVVEHRLGTHGLLFLLASPLVHSSHGHLLGNLSLLLPGGAVAERLVDRRSYVGFVYAVGALSNVLPPVLGVGGFGVGISGAFYGLFAFVGVAYVAKAYATSSLLRRFLYTFVGVFGLSFALSGVQQWVGAEPVAPGTATGAHLLGVLFGLGWAVWWLADRRRRARQ